MSSIKLEQIIDIIRSVDAYEVDYDNLDPNQRLLDQGLDSLDMMNLYFEIENEFDISISIGEDDDSEKNWSTINKIIESVENCLNA
nr:phosphopantetheine-binding protein [Pseudodesulfovibrio sp.]